MRLALSCVLLAATATGVAHAQPPTPNPTVDPVHVVITEPVKDSAIPVQLMYVEMLDGVYSPIGLRKPPGNGPFRIQTGPGPIGGRQRFDGVLRQVLEREVGRETR